MHITQKYVNKYMFEVFNIDIRSYFKYKNIKDFGLVSSF